MFIKEIKTKRGELRYAVSKSVSGKSFRKTFKTRERAKGYLELIEIQAASAENQCVPRITRLSDGQLQDAEAAVRMLGDEQKLLDAVEYFKKNYIPIARDQTLLEAVRHLLDFREKGGRRSKTIKSLKGDLMPFVKWLGGDTPISSITSRQAEDFVLSKRCDITKKKTRAALTNLFNHCIHQGWLVVDIMRSVMKITVEYKMPKCFDVNDVEKLMQESEAYENGKFSLCLALGFFAGLRPEAEVQRLTWDNIKLEDGVIIIDKSKVRTSIRRIDISENLKRWLLKYKGQPIIPTENLSQFRSGLGAIRQAAGYKSGCAKGSKAEKIDSLLKDWVKNGFRHSYASYLYAEKSSLSYVADQMGNSEVMVKRHYKALTKKGDADRYFSIMPS